MSKEAQEVHGNQSNASQSKQHGKPPAVPKTHFRRLSHPQEFIDVRPTQQQLDERQAAIAKMAAYLEAIKLAPSDAKPKLHGASSRSASSSPSVSPASSPRSITIKPAHTVLVRDPLPKHVKERLMGNLDKGLKDIKGADIDAPGMPSQSSAYPRSPSSSRSKVSTSYEDQSPGTSPRASSARWVATVSPVLNKRTIEGKQQEPLGEQQPQSAVARLEQQGQSPASRDRSPSR